MKTESPGTLSQQIAAAASGQHYVLTDQSENLSDALELMQLRAHGASQDTAAAQRLNAFATEYEANNPPSMLSDAQIDDLVKHRKAEYEQARDALAASKTHARPAYTQQDQQLDMAYRNGFDDGEVLGRLAMLRVVCKWAIVCVALGMLAAFIFLG